ncbi:MAG TPA: VWA domain-containing protein [Thermoanaerobaculia bacterium]
MKHSRRAQSIAILLAAAALGLAPWPGAAQQKQTFAESTSVVAVEVPVQVVKDGEPVRGLKASDFEVYEGRKKMNITGFEMLDLAAAVPAGTPAAAAAQVPVSARRHFLMLFDLSFSEPKSIAKARQAAQRVVDGLHPTDLVAVGTYSSLQGTQLVLGFTPDRRQIAAALDTLGLPKLIDRAPDPLRLVLTQSQRQIDTRPSTPSQSSARRQGDELQGAKDDALIDTLTTFATQSERADRNIQQQEVRKLTQRFGDLARLMGEVEGRKYVVYLSEGYDSSLVSGKATSSAASLGAGSPEDQEARQDIGDESRIQAPTGASGSDDKFGDTRSQNAVEKMLESFRRADCMIEAVDIGGLRAGADLAAHRGNGREALFNMAKSTGGELFENYNDLSAAMGQMMRRTSVTYVLAFQPEGLKEDGSYHNLRVELKNAPRGTRVVYRQGYYSPRPYKDQSPFQRLLEASSDVMGQDGGTIGTAVLAAPFAGKDRANVPVVIEVDGPTLLAGKQVPQLPVEIYVYALDQNGSVQDFMTQTVGLDLTKAETALRQGGLKFFGNLELPPGAYSIRTLVRNGTTGNSSLRITELMVPSLGQGAPALMPGIFVDPAPGRWVNLRQAKKAGQPDLPYLFMLKDQPYVPTSRPALSAGQDARLVLQGYNLGAGEWKAEVKVLGADGRELPGGALQVVDREAAKGGNPTRMVANFRPPSLPPGDYTLRVTLTDGSGKSETSTARFAVAGAAGARGGR